MSGFFFTFIEKKPTEYKHFLIFMVLNSDLKTYIDNTYILRQVIHKIGGL